MGFLRRLGCACVALLCVPAAAAQAAPVTVLGADGRARVVQDPFVPTAAPLAPARGGTARLPRAKVAAPAGPTVRGELRRLLAAGAIDAPTHDAARS